ncbi:MAG: high frequency lysogenization protein HflD [Gammaproteobacteria bacterium]|nr:high frequency lysogenization protein HflD [Gammaproteobacteria bacterium]
MSKTLRDATLALAGIFQAAALVKQVAHDGYTDSEAFAASIHSLFETHPETTEAVYGGTANLQLGLKTLSEQLSTTGKRPDHEIMRYSLSVMILARKLSKHEHLMDVIVKGIERARTQAGHFGPVHDNVIANLAGIYVETVSLMQPRIIVNGAHGHLSHAQVANKVRALLLAAIRSVILWRQCGGSRWQLLFKRRMITAEATRLLGV